MTSRRVRRARQKWPLLVEIPWVELVMEDGVPCDGIKQWMSWKSDEVPDRAKCKWSATFAFTALDDSPYALTGRYCIHHVVPQIEEDEVELERYLAWKKAEPERAAATLLPKKVA